MHQMWEIGNSLRIFRQEREDGACGCAVLMKWGDNQTQIVPTNSNSRKIWWSDNTRGQSGGYSDCRSCGWMRQYWNWPWCALRKHQIVDHRVGWGVLSVTNVRDPLTVKGNTEEIIQNENIWNKKRALNEGFLLNVRDKQLVGVNTKGRSMWWLCQISSKTTAKCDKCVLGIH